MDAAVSRNSTARPLELLGISDIGERTYRALLERHKATAATIAGHLGISLRVARKLLGELEALGLATHTPKVPRVYVAAPAEFAVTALVRRQQAMLEQVRVAIPELEAHAGRADGANGQDPVLELIRSRAQLGVVLTQMFASFRNEALCFQRAPVLAPSVATPARARARVRTVSDTTILDAPGMLARIRADVARGEQARMLPSLPFKMVIFDRRAAIVAIDGKKAGNAATLLVHRSPLLEALCLLFEFVWEHATPIMFGHADGVKKSSTSATNSNELADALIPLLAAGLNDKAIAQELGISSATLNRRMAELMRVNQTRSRFQLGWHAALAAASQAHKPQ